MLVYNEDLPSCRWVDRPDRLQKLCQRISVVRVVTVECYALVRTVWMREVMAVGLQAVQLCYFSLSGCPERIDVQRLSLSYRKPSRSVQPCLLLREDTTGLSQKKWRSKPQQIKD